MTFKSYFFSQIKEGLISTYPKKNLKAALYKMGIHPDMGRDDDAFRLYIPINSSEKFIATLKAVIDTHGYKISKRAPSIDDSRLLFLVEKKYTGKIPNEQLPVSLYHLTHEKNIPNIKKYGLLPKMNKTKDAWQSDGTRIYFIAKTDNSPEIKLHMDRFITMLANSENAYTSEYTCLKTNIAHDPNYTFYYDPFLRGPEMKIYGVYTHKPVPPHKLQIVYNF